LAGRGLGAQVVFQALHFHQRVGQRGARFAAELRPLLGGARCTVPAKARASCPTPRGRHQTFRANRRGGRSAPSASACSRAAWACDSPSDALICSLSTLKQHLTAFNGLAFTRQHLRDTAAFQVLCQRLEG
jgi:hypothetical protein